MEKRTRQRLSREDWVREALGVLQERGADGVKIVVIAERMGVTSGSFYWHFKDLQDLLNCLLDYWEHELTDAIIELAKSFGGPPKDRILNLMLQVVEEDAAAHNHAILVWARKDPAANEVFSRTLRKRFDFARWMFKQCGFSDWQAKIRGRLMVAYLMGESATDLKSDANWKAGIRAKHKLMTVPSDLPLSSKIA
jgi:AcrR family transcriptional regulator